MLIASHKLIGRGLKKKSLVIIIIIIHLQPRRLLQLEVESEQIARTPIDSIVFFHNMHNLLN
jgi:hypothetical protein